MKWRNDEPVITVKALLVGRDLTLQTMSLKKKTRTLVKEKPKMLLVSRPRVPKTIKKEVKKEEKPKKEPSAFFLMAKKKEKLCSDLNRFI